MKNKLSFNKTIILSDDEHTNFLASKPADLVTGDIFKSGDEVTVCKICKSVFLVDSINYLGWRHCNQASFLKILPSVEPLYIHKKSGVKNKAKYDDVFGAWLMDWFILFLCIILGITLIHLIETYLNLFVYSNQRRGLTMNLYIGLALILYIYSVTRDAWFNGQSIGKLLFKIRVIQNGNGKKCSLVIALARSFLSPFHILSPVMWLLKKDSLVDKFSNTSIIAD